MRYDPHRGVYVGAPDERTDAQKAEDAPLERTVSGVGGFLFGAIVGAVATVVLTAPKRGS